MNVQNRVDIKDIQIKILEIFKEFDKICKKHKLRYYAIGGTCIGAVRHKGFIPWDDDIDVVMPIDDYFKFINIYSKELEEPYELVDYRRNVGENRRQFCKIQNKNTTFVENSNIGNYKKYTGVFIDIMPIVGCPKNNNKCNKYIKKLQMLIRLDRAKNSKILDRKNFKSKVFSLISKPLMIGKNEDYYFRKWEKRLTNYQICPENNILFPWRIPLRAPYSNVFPYDFFKEAIRLPFENTTIMCPIDYDGYLKKDFGNYMKLPPAEKQKSNHPTFLIDLAHSYKEYIDN